MIKINVISNNISWKKYIKNPNSFIDKKTKLLNKKNKLYKKNTLICSLLLSGAKEIKKLNKKFRKKNKSTDVLSFPLNNKNILDNNYLGDIAISFEFVSKRSIKTDFKYELDRMWVHGYLHLLGYNHIVYKLSLIHI